MAPRIKTLNQLKDSQLLYDQDPPPFGLYFIAIMAAAMVGALIWSIFTPRTYVVKSTGTVVSEARNYIMSAYTGEIIRANVSEGDYVEQGDVLFQVSSMDLDVQAQQLTGMIQVNQEKIRQYGRLESCIKDGVNLFDENNEVDKPYYYQYEAYINQVAQKELDISSYQSYDYTDEQIESAIRTNEAAIAEVYYSTLREIANSIRTCKNEIESCEIQLDSINYGQAEYMVTASASGIVHMDTEYKTGMVVQAGAAIGSIVNENDRYYVSVYTSSNDMPLIHVGDQVDVAVSGLTQTIYGTIGGQVTYIASEATVNQENGTSSFLTEIELDSTYLVSNQGNKVNLSNGMAVEARIQYDEVTYFHYLLECLGVLTR